MTLGDIIREVERRRDAARGLTPLGSTCGESIARAFEDLLVYLGKVETVERNVDDEARYLLVKAVLFELIDGHVGAGVLSRIIRGAIERQQEGEPPFYPPNNTTHLGCIASDLTLLLLPVEEDIG